MTDQERDDEHLMWMVGKYQIMLATYLNKTALIEDKIDEIITASFDISKDHKWKYINIILSDLAFGTKVQKLQKTLKEIRPDLADKFEKNNLASRIEKVRKTRNMFAYSLLNTNPDYLAKRNKNEIGLLNPRNPQPRQQISLTDFDNLNMDARKIFETLSRHWELT